MNNNQIPLLDNLRALAAWSVCLYHFMCTTTGFLDPEGMIYKTFYFGQNGVQLFFIISGLVIPWSMYEKGYRIENLGRFILKRLIRLEPPYMFSVLAMLAVIFLRKYSPSYDGIQKEVTLQQVCMHLGYLIPFSDHLEWLNNVYWTLAIEFQYYFFMAFAFYFFTSGNILFRSAGYLLLFVPSFLFGKTAFLPIWLPLFGIGISLFQFKKKIIGNIEFGIVALVALAVLILLGQKEAAVIGLAGGFLILFFSNYSFSWLTQLGKHSYSVYLIHPILGATVLNVLSHYVHSTSGKFSIVVLAVLITAAGSYLMYRMIEKPSKRISSSILYRGRKKQTKE